VARARHIRLEEPLVPVSFLRGAASAVYEHFEIGSKLGREQQLIAKQLKQIGL
jgi:hypothetical protein